MEILVLVSLIVGIAAGLIAVGDKMKRLLPRRVLAKRKFDQYYGEWVTSGTVHCPRIRNSRG